MKKIFLQKGKKILGNYFRLVVTLIAFIVPAIILVLLSNMLPNKGNVQVISVSIITFAISLFNFIMLIKKWNNTKNKTMMYLYILGLSLSFPIAISFVNYALASERAITHVTVTIFTKGCFLAYIITFLCLLVGYIFSIWKVSLKLNWQVLAYSLPYFALAFYVKNLFLKFLDFITSSNYDTRLVATMLIDEKAPIETLDNLLIFLISVQIIIFTITIGGLINAFILEKTHRAK